MLSFIFPLCNVFLTVFIYLFLVVVICRATPSVHLQRRQMGSRSEKVSVIVVFWSDFLFLFPLFLVIIGLFWFVLTYIQSFLRLLLCISVLFCLFISVFVLWFQMIQADDSVCSFALAQSDTIGALAEEAGGKPKLHATAKVKLRGSS